MSRIAVIGSGAWGTAIALSLARRGGHSVTLWAHSQQACDSMCEHRENLAFLPGFSLAPEIVVTADVEEALRHAEIVISVMPSHHVRSSYQLFARFLRPGQILVSATKGLEDESYLRMSEVIQDVLAGRGLQMPCGVMSGPSFAREVASGFPTAVTIAFRDLSLASHIQREFSGPSLRLYTNDDVIGVELGGALKNVSAIATGVVAGLGLGHNSVAALITRGIAEITRLAVAGGGRQQTLAGLAGLSDLVLTCTGSLSRNRLVGIELGKGRRLAEILTGLHGQVAEGVRTASAALGLATLRGVEMPITSQVAQILYEDKSPMDAMRELMARPGRDEA